MGTGTRIAHWLLRRHSELADLRKKKGASDVVLRGGPWGAYLKEFLKTVSKMMRLHWINELEIDTLESKGHWASKDQGAIYRLENVQDSRNVWLWFSFPHWHENAGVGWLHRPHSPSLKTNLWLPFGHKEWRPAEQTWGADAIGLYVHPTRYRQVVETVSSRNLVATCKARSPRTRRIAQLWQEFITKIKDRERSQPRRTNTWNPVMARRDRR